MLTVFSPWRVERLHFLVVEARQWRVVKQDTTIATLNYVRPLWLQGGFFYFEIWIFSKGVLSSGCIFIYQFMFWICFGIEFIGIKKNLSGIHAFRLRKMS